MKKQLEDNIGGTYLQIRDDEDIILEMIKDN